jgi:hypothetical protein
MSERVYCPFAADYCAQGCPTNWDRVCVNGEPARDVERPDLTTTEPTETERVRPWPDREDHP